MCRMAGPTGKCHHLEWLGPALGVTMWCASAEWRSTIFDSWGISQKCRDQGNTVKVPRSGTAIFDMP